MGPDFLPFPHHQPNLVAAEWWLLLAAMLAAVALLLMIIAVPQPKTETQWLFTQQKRRCILWLATAMALAADVLPLLGVGLLRTYDALSAFASVYELPTGVRLGYTGCLVATLFLPLMGRHVHGHQSRFANAAEAARYMR